MDAARPKGCSSYFIQTLATSQTDHGSGKLDVPHATTSYLIAYGCTSTTYYLKESLTSYILFFSALVNI